VLKVIEKNMMLYFPIGYAEPWLIQHYEPGEGFPSWHCERATHLTHQRALVFMTYLNDVEDGGETQLVVSRQTSET